MPVRLDLHRRSHDGGMEPAWRRGPACAPSTDTSGSVCIALVNNMPQPAFKATERQFISLLNAASDDIPVLLSLHVLSGSEQREESGYCGVETIFEKRLDGLIVTGRESNKANLKDETYWGEFAALVDWARENTAGSIWSCLAAHAAVLHIDGVARQRKAEKYSGIFECVREGDHLLTSGAPLRFQVPHSRWHGLSAEELMERGYRSLARTADGEPDTFVKQENSLLVFFQGHPEYEADTLLREYRRDVGRYLRKEVERYPCLPRHCTDTATAEALSVLQERACSRRDERLLLEVSELLNGRPIANTWHANAVIIYRNWLNHLWAMKSGNQVEAALNDLHPIQSAF